MTHVDLMDEQISQSISEHYDKRGQDLLTSHHYEQNLRFEDRTRTNVLKLTEAFLQKWQKPGARLLDLCCGIGSNSIFPAQIGYQVLGVDLSPKSIEACHFLAKNNQVSDLTEFFVADVSQFLSSTREKFDVIQIYVSIYYFDRAKILSEIKSHLKPGGHLICVETNGSQPIANLLRNFKAKFRKTRASRDSRSLENLTRLKDLQLFREAFPESVIVYVDFFSLLALPLSRWKNLADFIFKVGTALDHILLNKLGFRILAFKFVIVSRNSLSNESK